jgi:hypothetical protein
MKIRRQSKCEDGSASESVNPLFDSADEDSSVTLSRFLEKFGYSDCRTDELSRVYRPYRHQIENGIKANLSRTIVVKIARGLVRLGVGVLEGHRLLAVAGRPTTFLFARIPSAARVKKTDAR